MKNINGEELVYCCIILLWMISFVYLKQYGESAWPVFSCTAIFTTFVIGIKLGQRDECKKASSSDKRLKI